MIKKNKLVQQMSLALALTTLGVPLAQAYQAQKVSTEYDAFSRVGSQTVASNLPSPADAFKVAYDYSNHGSITGIEVDGQTWMSSSNVTFDKTGDIKSASSRLLTLNGRTLNKIGVSVAKDALGRIKSLCTQHDDVLESNCLGSGNRMVYGIDNINYSIRNDILSYDRLDGEFAGKRFSYGYNGQNQLTNMSIGDNSSTTVSTNFTYDDFGNLLSRSGTFAGYDFKAVSLPIDAYDKQNRRKDWLYDDQGRLLEDEKNVYKYNASGRLSAVVNKSSGDLVAYYLYDPDGNRGMIREGAKTTYFVRDQAGDVLRELVEGEGVERRDIVASNPLATMNVMSKTEGANEVELVFNDRLGSPTESRAYVAGTSAIDATDYEYAPFGGQLLDSKHEGANGFTGHEDDLSTGLTYMKARYYDSTYARFNRPDPARDFSGFRPASHNLYQYVGNDPVNSWDPSGLMGKHLDGQPCNEPDCTGGPLREGTHNIVPGTKERAALETSGSFSVDIDDSGPIVKVNSDRTVQEMKELVEGQGNINCTATCVYDEADIENLNRNAAHDAQMAKMLVQIIKAGAGAAHPGLGVAAAGLPDPNSPPSHKANSMLITVTKNDVVVTDAGDLLHRPVRVTTVLYSKEMPNKRTVIYARTGIYGETIRYRSWADAARNHNFTGK